MYESERRRRVVIAFAGSAGVPPAASLLHFLFGKGLCRRDAETVSNLRSMTFFSPGGASESSPGRSAFCEPGVAGKLRMSPERAIEEEFLSPLQGSSKPST
jgi:hypothetical protein